MCEIMGIDAYIIPVVQYFEWFASYRTLFYEYFISCILLICDTATIGMHY